MDVFVAILAFVFFLGIGLYIIKITPDGDEAPRTAGDDGGSNGDSDQIDEDHDVDQPQ